MAKQVVKEVKAQEMVGVALRLRRHAEKAEAVSMEADKLAKQGAFNALEMLGMPFVPEENKTAYEAALGLLDLFDDGETDSGAILNVVLTRIELLNNMLEAD
ncbi:MAG: hypothetical protein QGH15_20125 [Kiritimatiellia bacterium]|jgi:hypothetical protein|nr:hypothetical protein [Kiritimatiellia bacterium]